jgi:hypothetical protein
MHYRKYGMCNIEHISENACGVYWSINQEREKGVGGGGGGGGGRGKGGGEC